MPNQTGGDFCGGLPTAERNLLQSSRSKPPTNGSSGSDTSHLSNPRAVQQATCPATEFRHGWHPNMKNLKG